MTLGVKLRETFSENLYFTLTLPCLCSIINLDVYIHLSEDTEVLDKLNLNLSRDIGIDLGTCSVLI